MRNGETYGISGSEDCLYISVFTPNLEGSAAVMVFDYHDNFRTGYNGTKKYSPEIFAEENVIVVTISYRLSILGYLTTEDGVIPANNGLKDYLLGLKWVKENIKSFGGDPNRITLMGSKGGGTVANIMLYSKQASGLFNAVTIQSGTSYEAIYFPENAKQFALKLAELVGVTSSDSQTLLEELQKIDVVSLYDKESDVLTSNLDFYEKYQRSVFPFAPIIEPEHPDAILTTMPENGKIINDVPVLIGFNSREGLDHTSYILFEPKILSSIKDFFVHFPIRTNFRFDVNNTAFVDYKEDIRKFYLTGGYLHYNNLLEYAIYVGDTLQNYAINYAARKLANELNSPTYYYMFDFYGSFNENMLFLATNIHWGIENWGATVADELCYLHVCNRIRKNYNYFKGLVATQNELKVLKKMVRLWTNFAKTGNPTPSKNDDVLKRLSWQPIEKGNADLKYLHITKNFRMELNPLGAREKFWDETLKKYGNMAVEGVAQKVKEVHEEL
ncbi:unnamed protein product [Diatraea saccharalis]|uniref:Carboxylesterase type B domain-containing protein n=1 Tax=Diatraea saccharalis TaxID=40085 RepID=A0A9N9WHS9_9NEOP|nr:unnamed protein product [Diatraea saccharalis]